jgi:hypothetical protein
MIPLVFGVAELTYFVGRRPPTSIQQVEAFLPGFLIIMAGLVIAGPWLTMVGSRLLARRASRPATLIAARRLADNPQAGFRAISGLVIALFVTSVAIGVITTIVAERGPHHDSAVQETTLRQTFYGDKDITAVPAGVLSNLRAVPGAQAPLVVRRNPDQSPDALPGLVACADLAAVPELGQCPAGAQVVMVWDDMVGPETEYGGTFHGSATVWQVAPESASALAGLPVLSIVVGTNGTTATVEQARTVLENAFPDSTRTPSTNNDFDSDFTTTLAGWRQLANVVILTSLPIAGCSLAVSVAGGLGERRRPFSLLRLSGVQLGVLRRVVALESAVPLLLVAAVAIGVGFLAAQLFLRAQMDYSLHSPGLGYYVTVAAGLLASLGIIASMLPLLSRITGPETARND